MLSTVYGVLGELGQSEEHARDAYARRDRVSERERFLITYQYHDRVTGDQVESLRTLDLWKATYPRDFVPANARALIFNHLGMFERAIDEAKEALARQPDHPFPVVESGVGVSRSQQSRRVAPLGTARHRSENRDISHAPPPVSDRVDGRAPGRCGRASSVGARSSARVRSRERSRAVAGMAGAHARRARQLSPRDGADLAAESARNRRWLSGSPRADRGALRQQGRGARQCPAVALRRPRTVVVAGRRSRVTAPQPPSRWPAIRRPPTPSSARCCAAIRSRR